mgnify:CR=1 FL=1
MESRGSTVKKLVTIFVWISLHIEVLLATLNLGNMISEGVKCDVSLIVDGPFELLFESPNRFRKLNKSHFLVESHFTLFLRCCMK